MPSSSYTLCTGGRTATCRRHPSLSMLEFAPASEAMLPTLLPLLRTAPWRTCDYTAGGLMLWAEYFHYTMCVSGETLFVKGVSESDVSTTAFSVPVGKLPFEVSVAMIRDYCRHAGIETRFSAVPEEALSLFEPFNPREVVELGDMADYIYDAQSLATLTGKRYNKKRNHVNRFMTEHPDYTFEPLSAGNIEAVRRFYHSLRLPFEKPAMAHYERMQVDRVLSAPEVWPFEGAVLSVPDRGVVAFTLGEPVGDTLHIHIEKMDHEIAGAGETVNQLYARMMTERHTKLKLINRQDDAGDPGLRHAKESYHPTEKLRKFDLII